MLPNAPNALSAAAVPTSASPTGPRDLTDASIWGRPDIRGSIDALRAHGPVQHADTASEGAIWCVLSYEHATAVLTDAATFSSTGGSLLGSGPGVVPAGSGRMMALTDGPRHRALRSPLLPFLSPRGAKAAASRIAELAAAVVSDALTRSEVNLVDMVSTVPLIVMCDLLDIPGRHRERVVQVCDEAFLGVTPEERRAGHQKLIPYLFEQAMFRRKAPAEDLISKIANYKIDGRLLPIEDVVLNLDNILVGGVQTVRHTAAMGIKTLIDHPRAWRALSTGEVGLDTAIDELLRWTSVGLHMLRTAATDVVLGGQPVRAGDRVVVWTWAANHDGAAFDQPEELRLDRSPNRHLALGLGAHYCIGAPLAKAELGAILTALFEWVSRVELIGEPVHNHSLINFGFDLLPVRVHPR